MLTKELLKTLRKSLSENKLEDVLQELLNPNLKEFDDDYHLTILNMNLTGLNKKKINNTISDDDFLRERSKIVENLLEVLDKIEKRRDEELNQKLGIVLVNSEEELQTLLEEKLEFRYKIVEKVHSSDRSIIFKVKDETFENHPTIYKAIKVIKPFSILKPENLREIHFDIKNLEKISANDGFITIYDRQIKTYPWYFIMRFINGKTIGEYIKSGWIWRMDEILKIFLEIMKTVRICHQNNIIHGDLKPDEIILNRDEENSPEISPFRVIKDSFFVKKTQERILYNCQYMSPEEFSNGVSKIASDQFSIGLIIFEMLEGKPLYSGENTMEVIKKRISHQNDANFVVKSISSENCPYSLITILDKMLKYNPEDRYDDLQKPIHEVYKILSEETKKLEDDALIVQSSYDRCRKNPDFFNHFYSSFFKKNKSAKGKFKNIEQQYSKLDMALDRLVALPSLDSERIRKTMSALAQKHSDLKIEVKEYDIFSEELLLTIKKFDESNWEKLESSWKNVLNEGVRLMKNYSMLKVEA